MALISGLLVASATHTKTARASSSCRSARSRGEFINMVASSLTVRLWPHAQRLDRSRPCLLSLPCYQPPRPKQREAPKPRPVDLSEPRASRYGKSFASALPSSLPQVPLPPNPKLVPPRRETVLPPLSYVHSTPYVFCSVSWRQSTHSPCWSPASTVLARTPLSTTPARTRRTRLPGHIGAASPVHLARR